MFSTSSFIGTFLTAFLLPGFVWWRTMFGRSCSLVEEIIFSFLLSICLLDTVMLIISRLGWPLSIPYVGGSLFLITGLGAVLAWHNRSKEIDVTHSIHLSSRGWLLLMLLMLLTFFIRTIYLTPNILPTATDLGHHAYWSDYIVQTHKLPIYEKIEIVTHPYTGTSTIAPPRPIPDFIIGEHLPLAFFSMLSGLDFFSAFPVIFLNLINVFSVLAVALLAYRLAEPMKHMSRPEFVLLFTVLILGPLFALASPQAKFVTGGVVGNLFGNLFIPVILLLFYRALSEKNTSFFTLAVIFSFFLAYTHHLSTLVLAFILISTLIVASIALSRMNLSFARDWLKHLFSPPMLIFFMCAIGFMVWIALPTYLDIAAIDSAIGTPTKATRTGLSFLQISNTIGLGKVTLGLFGLLIAALTLSRQPLAAGVMLGWTGMLLVMALFPQFVWLDIPSRRVGSYLAYPLGLTAGFALAWFIERLRTTALPRFVSALLVSGLIAFTIGSGSQDNASTITQKNPAEALVQTFAATTYLAQHTDGAPILKDHNYLIGDAWMKLFFKRDYGYPLSRGLFGRYEEGGNRRERCTLAMISTPNTAIGERCFAETGVRYLVVNPVYDRAQFEKSDVFSKLYTSQTAAIFERNEK